ncbi:MAG: hypothetical protein KAZ36_03525 [Bacteroidales bacterium]|nr:hypothetical protein [Bacteroidales bacterium]
MILFNLGAVAKLSLAENHHYPTLKGVLIFSDFHPIGRGKEGDENHIITFSDTPLTTPTACHSRLCLPECPDLCSFKKSCKTLVLLNNHINEKWFPMSRALSWEYHPKIFIATYRQ